MTIVSGLLKPGALALVFAGTSALPGAAKDFQKKPDWDFPFDFAVPAPKGYSGDLYFHKGIKGLEFTPDGQEGKRVKRSVVIGKKGKGVYFGFEFKW